VRLSGDTQLDLHVAVGATLSAFGLPASLPTPNHLPHSVGMVLQTLSCQVMPLPGAEVSLWYASTLSGPDGRYLVCLPSDTNFRRSARPRPGISEGAIGGPPILESAARFGTHAIA
jgi:hypothetical protein